MGKKNSCIVEAGTGGVGREIMQEWSNERVKKMFETLRCRIIS